MTEYLSKIIKNTYLKRIHRKKLFYSTHFYIKCRKKSQITEVDYTRWV